MAAGPAETVHPCKVFVGNLPFSMTQDRLASLFRPMGAVIGSKLVEDRNTGKKKGFGFVTFEKPEAADAAIARMHGQDCEGRPLTVKRATARGEHATEEGSDEDTSGGNTGQSPAGDGDGFESVGPRKGKKSSKSFKARAAEQEKETGKMMGWGSGDQDWA
eukprot:gb/GFBE01057450.1/.p1 GENE.gb/GFBE01057450.1/~~gb/GFBE01057450.1/.p1  ORF type:complete len:161 (+),score=34.33 gb/GFBE01057450.1/:1-483(+)